jgi:excisionase family DNA binding protein
MDEDDWKENPEAAPAMPEVMTVSELAEYFNVSTITIYRLLKTGQLPAFRVGSDWRFSADAIAQWTKEGEQGVRPTKRQRKRDESLRAGDCAILNNLAFGPRNLNESWGNGFTKRCCNDFCDCCIGRRCGTFLVGFVYKSLAAVLATRSSKTLSPAARASAILARACIEQNSELLIGRPPASA